MRQRDKTLALNNVLSVRRTQRQAAEMEAARAVETLRRADERRAEKMEELLGDQKSWSKCVAQSSLDLNAAQAWSARIVAGEAELGVISTQQRVADQECCRKKGDLLRAIGRFDAAEAMAGAAAKRVAHMRDEVMLGEIDDRNARRRASI